MQTRLRGQYNGKWPISLVCVSRPLVTVITAIYCSSSHKIEASGGKLALTFAASSLAINTAAITNPVESAGFFRALTKTTPTHSDCPQLSPPPPKKKREKSFKGRTETYLKYLWFGEVKYHNSRKFCKCYSTKNLRQRKSYFSKNCSKTTTLRHSRHVGLLKTKGEVSFLGDLTFAVKFHEAKSLLKILVRGWKRNDKRQGKEVSTPEEIVIKSKNFKRLCFAPARESFFFSQIFHETKSRKKRLRPSDGKKTLFPDEKQKNKKKN